MSITAITCTGVLGFAFLCFIAVIFAALIGALSSITKRYGGTVQMVKEAAKGKNSSFYDNKHDGWLDGPADHSIDVFFIFLAVLLLLLTLVVVAMTVIAKLQVLGVFLGV